LATPWYGDSTERVRFGAGGTLANMAKKKIDPRVLTVLLVLQAVIGTLTVRDISSRPKDQVRGPKLLWKVWGGTNTFGSVLYWLIGRKRAA